MLTQLSNFCSVTIYTQNKGIKGKETVNLFKKNLEIIASSKRKKIEKIKNKGKDLLFMCILLLHVFLFHLRGTAICKSCQNL